MFASKNIKNTNANFFFCKIKKNTHKWKQEVCTWNRFDIMSNSYIL